MRVIENRLKAVLDERGITIYRLAKDSGVTYPTVFAIANDKHRHFDLSVLDKICKVLQCQPSDLLTYVEDAPPAKKKAGK